MISKQFRFVTVFAFAALVPLLVLAVGINLFSIGQRVQTTGAVNVMQRPVGSAMVLGTQPAGALGAVVDGPKKTSGITWWNVNFNSGADGWVSENSLVNDAAPVITFLSVAPINPTYVTINWSTNEPSDSQVEYGVTTAYGSLSDYKPQLVTGHVISPYNLTPSTLYHFRMISKDAAGNVTKSADYTFTTASDADVTPPNVVITGPTASSTVAGNVMIDATATDSVGVTKVEFYVDGLYRGIDVYSPYQYQLDTTTLTYGVHALTARAYDAAGNMKISPAVNIIVDNRAFSIMKNVMSQLQTCATKGGYASLDPILQGATYICLAAPLGNIPFLGSTTTWPVLPVGWLYGAPSGTLAANNYFYTAKNNVMTVGCSLSTGSCQAH